MRLNLIPRVGEQNNNRGGDRNGGGDKMATSIKIVASIGEEMKESRSEKK